MRFESERELCCRRSTPLSRLGRTGELEWAPLIADSGNPLLLSLLHPDELWQWGHLQLQAFLSSKCASRFFLFFFVGRRDGRKAQGYLWSNHYTISSPQRPCCIHLSVGSPLSCSISPCHSLSHSLFTALFPHLSFIQSPSPLFLSVFRPSTRRSVGCDRRCVLVGGESEILYYEEAERLHRKTNPAKWGLV